MTHQYHEITGDFIRKEILDTALRLNLTNEEMAEKLGVSPRNYSYFKSGKYGCSSGTLIAYMLNLCTDTNEFLNRLKIIISESEFKL